MTTKKKTESNKKTKKKVLSKKTSLRSNKKKKSDPVIPEIVDVEIVDSDKDEIDDLEDVEKIATSQDRPVDESRALASTDAVGRYLMELKKYPLLTRQEEYDLAVKYFETKDPKAAEKLVTSNLRFVVKVAAEYAKFGAKLIDLIQEGNVGLMHAVREFNPYKGVKLITYAVWWIRGCIQEYLMKQYSVVRIGTTQNQRKLFYQLQKEKEKLDALGEEQNIMLLSSKLGISEDEVRSMNQRMKGRDVSLNINLDDESTTSLQDLQTDPFQFNIDDKLSNFQELHILSENIEILRPQLNERELFLLENRLLADPPMTLQEVGNHYGITREAVRQVEARLITKIRDAVIHDLDHPTSKE